MISTIDESHLAGPERSAASWPSTADSQARALFEGLLLQTALAPVARAMGFYGDLVVAEAARRIARGVP